MRFWSSISAEISAARRWASSSFVRLPWVVLPPHVGFVFEWIQEIYPELIEIALVAGHDRQPVHDGRRGDQIMASSIRLSERRCLRHAHSRNVTAFMAASHDLKAAGSDDIYAEAIVITMAEPVLL